MKKIFFALLFPIILFGQNERIFSGKCAISQSGGGSGYWTLNITNFNDPLGLWDATEITEGDKVYFTDGGLPYSLVIDTVVSSIGNTATVRVLNAGVTGISSVPTTNNAAVSRGTLNYDFLCWIANLSGNENQGFQEHSMYLIDSLLNQKLDTIYLPDGTPLANGDTLPNFPDSFGVVGNEVHAFMQDGTEEISGYTYPIPSQEIAYGNGSGLTSNQYAKMASQQLQLGSYDVNSNIGGWDIRGTDGNQKYKWELMNSGLNNSVLFRHSLNPGVTSYSRMRMGFVASQNSSPSAFADADAVDRQCIGQFQWSQRQNGLIAALNQYGIKTSGSHILLRFGVAAANTPNDTIASNAIMDIYTENKVVAFWGKLSIGGNLAANPSFINTSNTLEIKRFDGTDFSQFKGKKLNIDATNTASGTTGNQTINKAAGTVNIAAGQTSITVTNSLVTTASIVLPVIRTNDSTAVLKNCVPGSGTFTITLTAAATAETSIGFHVIN